MLSAMAYFYMYVLSQFILRPSAPLWPVICICYELANTVAHLPEGSQFFELVI